MNGFEVLDELGTMKDYSSEGQHIWAEEHCGMDKELQNVARKNLGEKQQ